jgi:hypothetical protein
MEASGKIRLSALEYEELSLQQLGAASSEVEKLSKDAKTRILSNCLAKDQSLQILGPVAEDMWKDMAVIKIEGMVSTDNAVQCGYPITMEVFQAILDSRHSKIDK